MTIQHRSDGVTLKDTYVNIRDTGEFVVNLATLPLAEAMHKSAFEHPSDVDEFEAIGLQKAPSVVVRPPRVALAPTAMECKLEREFTVGECDDHVVWGRVVRFHIRDDAYLPGGRVDTAALAPIGRLAAEYTLVDNVFTTPLDPAILEQRRDMRMHRLDGKPADWSAVQQPGWSASGSVVEEMVMKNSVDIPGLCNCTKVRRAARNITRFYDACLAESGLRSTQYSILGYLKRRGPMTMLRLADLMTLDRATIGHNLRPLEREGLLTIEVSPTDRRARIVSITEAGIERIVLGRAGWHRAQSECESLLGREEIVELRVMMERLARCEFSNA